MRCPETFMALLLPLRSLAKSWTYFCLSLSLIVSYFRLLVFNLALRCLNETHSGNLNCGCYQIWLTWEESGSNLALPGFVFCVEVDQRYLWNVVTLHSIIHSFIHWVLIMCRTETVVYFTQTQTLKEETVLKRIKYTMVKWQLCSLLGGKHRQVTWEYIPRRRTGSPPLREHILKGGTIKPRTSTLQL